MTQPVPNFPVPAFADLQSQILADFAGLPGADITLRVSTVMVMAKILSKLSAAEYAYLAALVNRALIPTLMVAPYLDVYCGGVGLKRDAPTPAIGSVTFGGTNTVPLPLGSQMQNSNGTVVLTTTAAGTVSGNVVTVPVVSAPGSAGNLASGAPVTLLVGVAGINASGTVTTALTGGADAETDAQLQVRLGARLSNPPQGGANADFVAWAKLVGGVTRVWVYPTQFGPGTVVVQFMMDGRVNPVPLSADVAAVQASINANAAVVGAYTAVAPTAEAVAVTVHNLVPAPGYTLAQAQAAATSAVAALNYTTTPGGYGWDAQLENYATGGTIFQEVISAAIANAAGVGTFDLTAPTTDITAAYGSIVQLSAPTFT